MNQRTFTGIVLLALIGLAVAYIWQPWNPGEPSLKLGLDLQGGLRVVLEADGETAPESEELQAARNVIEHRVNEFGVSEPLIQTSGSNRIVVEFPGLSSDQQDRALDLIGQQAQLEFRLVRAGRSDPLDISDLEEVAFTGEIISTASAAYNSQPGASIGPMVTFEIRNRDQSDFGNFTGSNLGRRMAIVMDGEVITAPQLNGRISDSGQITGVGTIDEASDLALVLRSGSLPFKLEVEEVRSIGPTLGQDSIDAGTTAGILGIILVIVAVLFMYGPIFGGALVFGLAVAMLFIFGILAGLDAALTLPGLGGLVLTLGAAVDGNVLSFERVKQLLREGKSLRVAMREGFGTSLPVILDANITTLIAALTLYQYTTGPVR
ncbi:MAG TPA: protein translocase subunit SecD, partial [Deinococcales bacterium]|nr:protein translocase subunit SecD [Deinococcales bacterium]